MATWISLSEFASMAMKDMDEVAALCENGELECKQEDGETYIEVTSGTGLVLGGTPSSLVSGDDNRQISHSFAEKTIGTIIAFHEKVIDAKEETLEALRRENKFLKEGLISMQEIYDEDRKTIETLAKQLETAQEELEFMKRKYKLMWGQVVENHAKNEQ
jgi:hypothetical protein